MVTFKITVTVWARSAAILSGVILVKGVHEVRTFFKEQDVPEAVDSAMLMRHGLAFGIYLVCSVISLIALLFVNFNPGSEFFFELFSVIYIGDVIAQFFSQLLLCEIFWLIANQTPVVKSLNDDEIAPVRMQSFTAEDEIAMLW